MATFYLWVDDCDPLNGYPDGLHQTGTRLVADTLDEAMKEGQRRFMVLPTYHVRGVETEKLFPMNPRVGIYV